MTPPVSRNNNAIFTILSIYWHTPLLDEGDANHLRRENSRKCHYFLHFVQKAAKSPQ
jgi:hypothetical protein